LQWVDLEVKLAFARRLMAALFAKPEAPSQFAGKIGWQDCLARLLVKRQLVPGKFIEFKHTSILCPIKPPITNMWLYSNNTVLFYKYFPKL
jgi:hypothetical protein